LVGYAAQTIRRMQVVVRAMQKPKSGPERRNLWARCWFVRRIVMLKAAKVR
jgi:hypothetical protein